MGRDALIVPFGVEADFLAPHPLVVLPDLHPRIRSRLDDYQLDFIGEVAAISESALCTVFGTAGRTLRARALGIDPRPVLPPERLAELSVAHILSTDTNDLDVLHALLRLLSERLGRRLRRGGLVARRLRLTVGYADHTDATRAVPLPLSALDAELWEAARRAFALANAKRLAVRGVTLTMERVEQTAGQLELWEDPTKCHPEQHCRPERSEGDITQHGSLRFAQGDNAAQGDMARHSRRPALQVALDRIHTRYGARSMTRGSQLAALTAHRAP